MAITLHILQVSRGNFSSQAMKETEDGEEQEAGIDVLNFVEAGEFL